MTMTTPKPNDLQNIVWGSTTQISSTMNIGIEDLMAESMVAEITKEIDREIFRELVTVEEKERYYRERDAKQRAENPALQEAWDNYQVLLRLTNEKGVNT